MWRVKIHKIFIGIDDLGYRKGKEKGRVGSIFVGWSLEEEFTGFGFALRKPHQKVLV